MSRPWWRDAGDVVAVLIAAGLALFMAGVGVAVALSAVTR